MISSSLHMAVILGVVGAILIGLEIFLRREFRWHSLVRSLWMLCLVWLLADWMMVKSQEYSQPSLVQVAFDRSDSLLQIPARRERLKNLLAEIEAWGAQSKQPLKYLSFAETAIEAQPKDLNLSGLQSLVSPVASAVQSSEGVVILISDGQLQDRARFSLPTYSVQIGEPKERDIWVESYQPVYTAFLKNRLKLPVVIGQRGFEGSKVAVSLWRGTEKVDETAVRLESEHTGLDLSIFPEKMGEDVYLLRIEPKDGELSSINNEVSFRIRTVRDKIRILHIGGRPSFDLKTWRLFLTRQPDVDLVSFYILRSLNDDPQAKNNELSLIPFPYEELFSTELTKVDLVILQNFDFNLYFQPFYLSNLASFVRQGGALLMIGGDQSFHRYQGSPLENLFSFKFAGAGNFEKLAEPITQFNDHPIIRGAEPLLRRLSLTGHHSLRSHPDALDLAQFKSGVPFLSVREVGKGRVISLNSDESWKIQTMPSDDPTGFARLARRMIQYLTFDPEMDPERLISGKWHAGKSVSLKLLHGQKSTWKITPLARYHGSSHSLEVRDVESVEYPIPVAGWYQVENSLLSEPLIFETEEKPWSGEWKHLIASNSSLQKISEESGGEFISYADRQKLFSLPLSGKQVISADATPWARDGGSWAWIALISSLFLLFIDFYLRKRSQWDA